MKKEFHVGDRVKVVKGELSGKAGVIRHISNDAPNMLIEFDKYMCGHSGCSSGREYKQGYCWWCFPEEIEKICDDKLIFKGNETILIKDGKEYVSKCADGDVYDKEKGLLLCLAKANGVSYDDLQKMIDGAEDKNKEAFEKAKKELAERVKTFFEAGFKALKERDNANVKPEAENTVKEVKRPAKVGEYIKIVNAGITAGTYGNGDILKVYKKTYGAHCETAKKLSKSDCEKYDHDNGNIVILAEEYVVLENYKPYKITLSEFWKSKDNLAIHCKNRKDTKELLEIMRKRGFFNNSKRNGDFLFNNVLNDKDTKTVDINTGADSIVINCHYKNYELAEVDLNN